MLRKNKTTTKTQDYSSLSTFTVVNFLNVVTGTCVTNVYNRSAELSSSLRRRDKRTRTRYGTFLKILTSYKLKITENYLRFGNS